MDAKQIRGWEGRFEQMMDRFGVCFARRDLRRQAEGYVRGLLGGVERKNSWQLAEHLGDEAMSKRELEVLQKVAGGNRNIDIATLLFISEETVKGHVKHIMEKLGASDRTEAVTIGVRRGMIQL